MTKKSPEKIQTIRDMAPGSSATEIAREIGVSLCTILKWGEEEGVRFLTKAQASKKAWADPEVRARMSQAHKKAWADPEVLARMSQASKKAMADPEVRARIVTARAGAKGVEIPKWVPVDLWDEFAEIAALNGEEAAASHCRRLKHDAQAFA